MIDAQSKKKTFRPACDKKGHFFQVEERKKDVAEMRAVCTLGLASRHRCHPGEVGISPTVVGTVELG